MSLQASRREFLKSAILTTGAAATAMPGSASASALSHQRPNILMICADQFRADFVGANSANPCTMTPNLDLLARRGANFRNAVCNQPLCSPSRSSFLTGVTATQAKVWKLGLELDHSVPTVATALRSAGYATAFCGKWHLARVNDHELSDAIAKRGTMDSTNTLGLVPSGASRGGFDDLFEGANVLEFVSHPYQGHYWDTVGSDAGFHDEYRVDFITDRAVRFLEQKHDRPWLLFVSQLEPHHQNDVDFMVPPDRYKDSFDDPYVPADLRDLPGNWQTRLPGYYGCVRAIDDCVGKLVATLEATGQLENTVIVFFSDHGCTFRTRLGEYKRSPHDSSIRVPLIFAGPGVTPGTSYEEIVSLLDLTPTLIDATGTSVPKSMMGKSLLPLINDRAARDSWESEAYIQISSSICGRAIRTRGWVYCAYDPTVEDGDAEFGEHYVDFALYSIGGDPAQQTNLVGRSKYRDICNQLRTRLEQMIVEHGEPKVVIKAQNLYA